MKSVLKKIKPSEFEQKQFMSAVDAFTKKLKKNLSHAKVILGGSAKKGTIIAGNHDIDIFVAFDYQKYLNLDISKKLGNVLKNSFPDLKINKVHGSRDYYQTVFHDYPIEIIPVLEIKHANQAQNITDNSPLHAKWVEKHATQKIKDDIRLLKQFCKAHKLYGAESFISGFSGYILEILTINYGSFNKVLQAATKWKNQPIIDPSKFYPKRMALFHINNSKLRSPLIVIDPVDKTRNAASALSEEKYKIFIKQAKKYLKKPAEKYFEKTTLEIEKLRKSGAILLEITPLKGKHDVIGMKMLKVFNYLKKELQSFKINKSGFEWEQKNATLYFITKLNVIPKESIRMGPPLHLKEHVKDFKKKNKKHYIEKGKLKAKIKQPYPKLKDFLNNLLSKEYVKERVKKIKII